MVSLNPAKWFRRTNEERYRIGPTFESDAASASFLLGGSATASGETVTEFTALEISTVWACVRVIANEIATMPWPVYRRLDGTAREPSPEHPLYRLLYERPNSEQSAIDFRQMMMGHALLWHGGYAEIERSPGGTPIALWPIAPNRVSAERDRNGRLYWQVTPPTNTDDDIAGPIRGEGIVNIYDRDMFRINGLAFSGVKALSLVWFAREALGLTMSSARFGAQFFGNASALNNLFTVPGNLDDNKRQQWRKLVEDAVTGNNRFRVMIAQDGVKVQNFGVDPEKAQSLETRKYQVLEVCRLFGVPPHKVAELEKATFNNVEEQGIDFMKTLSPWTGKLNSEANYKLLAPDERDRFVAELDVDSVARAPLEKRATVYNSWIDRGIFSPNDVRRAERLNPLPPAIGDVYMRPVNMAPAGEPLPDNAPSTKAPTTDTRDAHAELIGDTVFRILHRIDKAAGDKATKAEGEQLRTWAAEWWAGQRDGFRASAIPALKAAIVSLRGESRELAAATASGLADTLIDGIGSVFVADPSKRGASFDALQQAIVDEVISAIADTKGASDGQAA